MNNKKLSVRPGAAEDDLRAEDFQQEYHELPEAFDEDPQLVEDTRSPLLKRFDAAPAGHMTIIYHRPFGAVVDHRIENKHHVYKFITYKTLRDLGLEGAASVPKNTPTIEAMFRCKNKGCTRRQCAKRTRTKLSSAITRVVRAKGPWSLMLTIPRLTDEELEKAYKVARDVAQHLQDTFDGVTCWGVIATAEYHSSGITEDSAQKAIRSGQRAQYPYHLHVIIPVAIAPEAVAADVVADVTTEANVFLRLRANKVIYKDALPGSLPMENPAQEIAAIAAGEKKESAPYASILHINELEDKLGRDDYLYHYFTKGLVSPLSSQRSDEKNIVAGIKRHKEINSRLSERKHWYHASTLQKGNTSFFNIAPFQKGNEKYRKLVSDNNARRQQHFTVPGEYKGIEAEAEVTPADFNRYPLLSVHEARDIIVEEKRRFLREQCRAAYEATHEA